jgi:hypothetical protein
MNTCKALALVSAAVTLGLGASAATSANAASSLVGNFTILNGAAAPSGGEVTFSLNGDGTIAASLVSTSGNNIVGLGFDSVGVNLPESNFAPTADDNPFGWTDMYGYQPSGFLCGSCGTSETWTIGNPGDFTSVAQALGGTTSTYDFFLYDSANNQWAANANFSATVPEPSTWAIMLVGFGGLGMAMRSRRRQLAASA